MGRIPMTKKFKIVHASYVTSFNSYWLQDFFNEYFEFVPWEANRRYEPGTGFYLDCLDFPEFGRTPIFSVEDLLNQGFKVIINNLMEVNYGFVPNTHKVCCPAWFWYNGSMWYQYAGYNKYRPQRQIQYTALMPLNRSKPHRTDFVKSLESLKDKMLWSYVSKGRELPNDGNTRLCNTQKNFNLEWQNQFNPEWYNQSYCSMAVETFVSPGSVHTPLFITEKTLKPIAFQHPFLVYGNQGTLQQLRNWGFETFNNLWDEEYDNMPHEKQRKDAIVDILKTLEITEHDPETLRRAEYNQNHFYDQKLVLNGIIKDVVNPILEYAETQ